MFTYVCLGTNNLQRAVAFYDPVMAALGHQRCDTTSEPDWDGWVGWGTYIDEGRIEVALWLCAPFNNQPAGVGNGTMVAFAARSWAQVQAFHQAALAHGGTSEGEPGLRVHYGPDFYAAYVRDPDGHKLAAVCRGILSPTI
ncbi:MAG: lactoylglutathione lyase [Burkholderiales bacterium PBB1]|nr:MAG: lactoylglutathione lyase [Burkholderiales bacterium PBB1]